MGDVKVESDQRGEIVRLKRELEESRIREEFYLTMIEKDERELRTLGNYYRVCRY